MVRRDFLKGAGFSAAGAGWMQTTASAAPADASADLRASPIMKSFTAEDHRRRLQRIGDCEKGYQQVFEAASDHRIYSWPGFLQPW